MNRIPFLVLAVTAALACPATEQREAPAFEHAPANPPLRAPAADAVSASPEHYRVLEKTPAARLLLASWSPGASDRPHSHPTAIWFALTPARLRIEHSGGTTLFRTIARGDSGVQPPVPGHSIANVGDREARLAMFEIRARSSQSPLADRTGAPAATSSGNEFQLLAEHGGVRLVELTLAPDEETVAHSHPATIVLALSDARLLLRERPGSERNFDLGEGETALHDPVRLHTVRNIGAREARLLILEVP